VNPGAGPLADLSFALVGPGRVGASLASWAAAAGARCLSVAGTPGSARAAQVAARLGAPVADPLELAAGDARWILVATPDAGVGEVARRLASRRRSAVVLHVSGALGASALAPLAAAGCRVGAFHPLRAFPSVEERPAPGTFYALDGDPEARALGRRLASVFGGECGVVGEEQRALYHWAATLAAGGIVTLLATARAVGRELGLPPAALGGYGELARGALAAALDAGEPRDAITGPAARGDLETFDHHLAALAARAPELVPLAVELARATLARRAESGPLDAAQRRLGERLAREDLLDRPKDRVLASTRPKPA
jgi:predicted short-subunit dehydrogenase-like oxidoreductase (DUF2520 family)